MSNVPSKIRPRMMRNVMTLVNKVAIALAKTKDKSGAKFECDEAFLGNSCKIDRLGDVFVVV